MHHRQNAEYLIIGSKRRYSKRTALSASKRQCHETSDNTFAACLPTTDSVAQQISGEIRPGPETSEIPLANSNHPTSIAPNAHPIRQTSGPNGNVVDWSGSSAFVQPGEQAFDSSLVDNSDQGNTQHLPLDWLVSVMPSERFFLDPMDLEFMTSMFGASAPMNDFGGQDNALAKYWPVLANLY